MKTNRLPCAPICFEFLDQYGIMVPQSNGVAARKEPLNHKFRFYFQMYIYGIMVPQSNGVAARKEPLNHDVRF